MSAELKEFDRRFVFLDDNYLNKSLDDIKLDDIKPLTPNVSKTRLSNEFNNICVLEQTKSLTSINRKNIKNIKKHRNSNNNNNSVKLLKVNYVKKKPNSLALIIKKDNNSNNSNKSNNANIYDMNKTLNNNGYQILKKLNKIEYQCRHITSNNTVFIKIIPINNKHLINCIHNEIKILTDIQSNSDHNKPSGFVKYMDSFEDNVNVFCVVSNPGNVTLFKHIVKGHQALQRNDISLNEWKNHVRILFKFICKRIHFLHTKMNIVILNLCLENIYITNLEIKNGNFVKHGNIIFYNFMYSRIHKGNGKIYDINIEYNNYNIYLKQYQSPKMFKNNGFNPFKTDVWSLGVCLYLMLIGKGPFKRPTFNDDSFQFILQGYMYKLLNEINKDNYISSNSHDLLSKIFCLENTRILIEQIINHKYCKINHKKTASIKTKRNEYRSRSKYNTSFL